MDQQTNDRIRERAYELWIANGAQDGESEANWLAAEQEVLASLASLVRPVKAKRTPFRQILTKKAVASAANESMRTDH